MVPRSKSLVCGLIVEEDCCAAGMAERLFVAEQSEQSRLLLILRGKDDQIEQMPPQGKPLEEDEIAVIEAWIREGARIPRTEQLTDRRSDHWSFPAPASSRFASRSPT